VAFVQNSKATEDEWSWLVTTEQWQSLMRGHPAEVTLNSESQTLNPPQTHEPKTRNLVTPEQWQTLMRGHPAEVTLNPLP
jgi:hypothetical protein